MCTSFLVEKVESTVLDTGKIRDLECKHVVLPIQSQSKQELVLNQSLAVGYSSVIWGSHRGGTVSSERGIVEQMATTDFWRPAKIVVTSDGVVWADNTHTFLAGMYRLGFGAEIGGVPYYIVNFEKEIPRVISVRGTVLDSSADIQKTVEAAANIENRVKAGMDRRKCRWKLADLYGKLQGRTQH